MGVPAQQLQQPFKVIRCDHQPVELFKDEPDMIPVHRFTELAGLSSKTVLKLIKARELPGCKIGRFYFIPKTALIEFLEGWGGLDDCS